MSLSKRWILVIILIIAILGILTLFLTKPKEFIQQIDPEFQVTNIPFPGAIGKNIERDGIFHSLAVSPTDPDIVYIGTETNAIFKTTDGGKTWNWLRKGLYHTSRAYPEVYDIIIHPQNEDLIFAALTNGPNIPKYEQAAGVYRSKNGGQNWERSINGLANVSVDSLAFDQANPSIIYLGTNGEDPTNYLAEGLDIPGGIYRSKDQGNTWQALTLPVKAMESRFERIIANDNCIIAIGWKFTGTNSPASPRKPDKIAAIGLIKSIDSGKTWTNITPSNTFAYYFDATPDCQTIYLTDDQGGGYISTDSGNNWIKSPIYTGGVIKISPFDSQTIYFASGSQVFKSMNGLQSANKIYQLSENHGIDDIEFTSDPNIIYMAGDGYRVYKTINSGRSFSQIADLRQYIQKNSTK